MNILIIEDDQDLNEGLCYSLTKINNKVKGAHTISEGRTLLDTYTFDVIILDCNLPDGNGFEFCKTVKKRYGLPVIFLTARDSEIDEIKGFEMGASDYITKPFSLSILKARLNNVIHQCQAPKIYVSGNIFLDLEQHIVKKRDERIELSKIEFLLLYYLMENANQILKKESILNYIWDCNGRYVDGNVVSVNVRRLRMKIEDDPSAPTHIISIRGIGYKWQGGQLK